MSRLNRIYYHYEQLEEFSGGMWRVVRGEQRKSFIFAAARLMKCSKSFKSAMRKAIKDWPNSCKHNLTVEAANRIAWLGHAGCCIAAASPEGATRAAWHTLDRIEQDAANAAALEVLSEWESDNMENDLLAWCDGA